VKWAEQLLVPVPRPGYITCSVLGLYKELPSALVWYAHKAGTLDISTEDFIRLIKQFISHNLEIAWGLCFHCLPLSLNPASNDAQIKIGALLLIFKNLGGGWGCVCVCCF